MLVILSNLSFLLVAIFQIQRTIHDFEVNMDVSESLLFIFVDPECFDNLQSLLGIHVARPVDEDCKVLLHFRQDHVRIFERINLKGWFESVLAHGRASQGMRRLCEVGRPLLRFGSVSVSIVLLLTWVLRLVTIIFVQRSRIELFIVVATAVAWLASFVDLRRVLRYLVLFPPSLEAVPYVLHAPILVVL